MRDHAEVCCSCDGIAKVRHDPSIDPATREALATMIRLALADPEALRRAAPWAYPHGHDCVCSDCEEARAR